MLGKTRQRALRPRQHAIFDLGDDMLLVFKPRGHREVEHTHPYAQRLLVLRGRLRLQRRRAVTLPLGRAVVIAAQQPHSTEALDDVWLLAVRLHRRARSVERGD